VTPRKLVPDAEVRREAKPYSPQTLADRWGCSAEKVRTMCKNGELASFTLGKLIRIPAHEVERYECQSTPSQDTEESGRSPLETVDAAAESRLARLTSGTPNTLPALSGSASQPRKANG
jgi:excisionase family DNA binding protein